MLKRLRLSGFQLEVLLARSFDTFCADLGNLLLLLLQAPIIAICVVVVWNDIEEATDTLYFVLNLSAVWFGAINSCRELVKERAIFLREAALGLEASSYVLAKFLILSMLALVQCLILTVIVNMFVPLTGNLIGHFLTLWAASLAGSALGLLISACVSTPDKAVALVPIFLIPQILFSDMVMNSQNASNLTKNLKRLTITQWSYLAEKELCQDIPDNWMILGHWLVVILIGAVCLLLAALLLSRSAPAPRTKSS